MKKVPAKPNLGKRSPVWHHARAIHLHNHPACAACGGTENVEVHHIHPYHLFPEKELDQSNLITLCEHPGRNCHYCFGHAYNWHGYVPTVAEDAVRHSQHVKRSVEFAHIGGAAKKPTKAG